MTGFNAPSLLPAFGGGPDQVVSADDFKDAFRNHPAGVSIITADSGDGPVGLTATSVFSVSVNPPLLVFSLSAQSSATPGLRKAKTVVVHLLGAGQVNLAQTFATSGIDRFADNTMWSRLATGEPFLPAASAWLRSKVVSIMDAGDSTVVVAQALEVHISSAGERGTQESDPLVYHNRSWHKLGGTSMM